MEIKRVLVLTILLAVVNLNSGLDDVPEFQYPCYVDVCTFPRQYCNSDERRCSPCSRAICHSPRVPTACRYVCIKYDEVTTTTKITSPKTTTTATRHNETGEEFTSLHLLMTYSVIATSILIVIIAIGIVCYCRRKEKILMKSNGDKESNRGVMYSPVNVVKQDHVVRDDQPQKPVQALHPCPTCGQLNNQRPYPENHQTHIGTETEPPSYRPYDSRVNMRGHKPLVGTPSDSTESCTTIVTTNSRLKSKIDIASPDESGSMHEKPWADSSNTDISLQRDMLNNCQALCSTGSNTDSTLPKTLNG